MEPCKAMPRDGSNIYSAPSGTTAVSGTAVASAPYNALVSDLTTDLNAARPISAGGTGATSASAARTNLGVSATDATITAIAALDFTTAGSMLYSTAADTFSLLTSTVAGRALLTAADAAAQRTALGIAIGTSGDTIPKNNTANTFSAAQIIAVSSNTPLTLDGTGSQYQVGRVAGVVKYYTGTDGTSWLVLDGSAATKFSINLSTGAASSGGVAIPTISSSDTLSNKTLSSPTLSGTVTVSGPINVTASTARLALKDTGSGTDMKDWRFYALSNSLFFQMISDDGGSGTNFLQITRSGITPTLFDLAMAFKASSIQARVATSSETSGALTSASANKVVQCSGNVTLPASGMTDGDIILLDPRGTARTVTRPAAHTMYIGGTDSATGTTGAHNIVTAMYHGSSKWTVQGSIA